MPRVILLALIVVSLLALAACEGWSAEEADYLDWQNDIIARASQFGEQAYVRLESAETVEDSASAIEQYLPNLKQIVSDAHKRRVVPERFEDYHRRLVSLLDDEVAWWEDLLRIYRTGDLGQLRAIGEESEQIAARWEELNRMAESWGEKYAPD